MPVKTSVTAFLKHYKILKDMPKEQADYQISLEKALSLIESDELSFYDLTYMAMLGDANQSFKCQVVFSALQEDNPDLTAEEFIANSDNYGSIWLHAYFDDGERSENYQLVDVETGKPL
jgi:hypothetical protein